MARSQGKNTSSPQTKVRAPIAILGYCMELPSMPDMSGEDLARIVARNEVVIDDYLDTNAIDPHEYSEDGNPWLYCHRRGNKFGESVEVDLTLLQITEKESKFMSWFQILALRIVWRGLEASGIPVSLLHKTRTGVFVAGYNRTGDLKSYPDETSLRGNLMSSLSDRIAYFLGTHGPNLTVETACSSSLVALSLAVDSIRNGSCDIAIVTSLNTATTDYIISLQATGVISQNGECRPLDDDASGTLRCEGCGCLIVCSMEWAKQNGYCGTIKSVIVNASIGSAGANPKATQGSGRVYEAPNVFGMAEMIRLCHKQVGLPLEKVRYVEAHATGTRVGDLIELEALSSVYKDSHDIRVNPLRVGSLKGNIGHAEVAAGMFSLIKASEMIRQRTFFPTGGRAITPRTDFDWEGNNIRLCLESEGFPVNEETFIGVNSFGVGGSYAHAVITEYTCEDDDASQIQILGASDSYFSSLLRPLLLNISAASTRHLEKYEEDLLQYLQSNPADVGLLDLCGLFAINRSKLACSRSYLVDSIDDLVVQLASDTNKGSVAKGSQENLTIAMVFTGQGSQWVSMGCGLMVFPVYRDIVTQFDALYRKLSGWSLLDKLTSLRADELDETMYAQPLTFMVQIGLLTLLQYFGVRANIALGHSAGEIAAMYCCGMLSLEDSAIVVFHRSRCQQALAGCGRMLAVQMDRVSAKIMLRDPSLGLLSCSIACVNSPSSVVIAGPQLELERVRQFLSAKQVKNTFLKGNTAFHCSMMEPILKEIDANLEFLNNRKEIRSDIPLLSTVTARPQVALRSEYIVHNIRRPVRFYETIEYLLGQYNPDVIIEVGPHKTLAPLLVECTQVAEQRARVLTSLSKGDDDVRSFWHLIMGLIDSGACVGLDRLYTDLRYRFSSIVDKRIPGHPMIPTKISQWIFHKGAAAGGRDIGPASGTLVAEDSALLSVIEISRATCSPMADHVMGGIAMLPGMYFVEAAIETWGFGHDDCLSMSDVTFHEMCPIPDRSKTHDTRKLFVRHSANKSNGLTQFTVESRTLQSSGMTLHCTGSMASFSRPDVFDGSQYIPGIKGLRQRRSATRDIGQDGLQSLIDSHDIISSQGQIYNVINEDDVTEYGASFRVINEVRTSADRSSIVVSLEFDHEKWIRQGGVYGVQLLDGILQLGFLNPYFPSGNVSYAGGFDLGIFVRKPVENPCFVHYQFVEDDEIFGKTFVQGDAMMYDSSGMLLCHLIGIKSIIGKRMTGIHDSVPVWQPMSLAVTSENVHNLCCVEGEQEEWCSPSSIMAPIVDLLHQKYSLGHGEACSLRIVEFWEDASSVPVVFDALTRVNEADLPSSFNFVIEVFIVSYDIAVLEKGYHIPPKHKKWLRLRLVSLPSGQESFDHFNFDVIAAWKRGSSQDRWDDPIEFLRLAGRLGYHGSLVLHDLDVGQMWEGYVEAYHAGHGGFSSCRLLRRSLFGALVRNQSVYLISKDADMSCQMHESFGRVASEIDVHLRVNARSMDGGDQQSICALAGEISEDPDEIHIVVLDGIMDDSEYAQDTFTLVARIVHLLGEAGTDCSLWVITSHAFVPPINVHRASLLPLVMGSMMTFQRIHAKFVDLAGPYDTLSSLILSKPGPHQFMIDSAGIVHQRIMLPPEIACPPRPLLVTANDSNMFYKCDLINHTSTSRAGSYGFFAYDVKPPGAGEVLVDIHYAALNFRDVMLTLNALPRSSFESSYYGYNLGMEGSGRVVAVGDGVDHVVAGDEVVVSGKGTIGSKLLASAVSKLDTTRVTMKDAACLLSVYTTAYYALIDLCHVKKGDRVLVHAAAGGVGHAAISICSDIGALIYATTSQSKREYCVDTLGVPKDRVFNSRDVSWFDDLMRVTEDEGVDIVLNSLAGEHQYLGIQCLRPGGRFCEIGKADIFNNEKLSLFAFRKNIHMFAIDMDRMALDDPERSKQITETVLGCINRGVYKVLPSTCFPMNRLKDAVEFMRSGAHIGKVVLHNYSEERPQKIACTASVSFSDSSYHLILGGAGGFGSKIIRWLYKNGARKFITTVRRDPSRVTRYFANLIASGATFEVVEADLSSRKDLEMLETIVMSPPVLGQVETMIHCAGIYKAFYFEDVSDDVLNLECDIKVQSALFLDQLSRKLESVKNFIVIGSNSAEATGPYFASYGASNAILASIARKRLSEGLPATALQMASLKDVGMVVTDQATLEFQKKGGFEFMNSACALMGIESMITHETAEIFQTVHLPFNRIKGWGSGWVGAHTTPVVESLIMFGEAEVSSRGADWTYNLVLERLIWLLTDVFEVEQGQVSESMSLSSLGIDSLAIMELRQQVQGEFGYSIDRSAFAMTVGDLSKDIYNRVRELAVHQDDREYTDIQNKGEESTAAAVAEVPSTLRMTKHIQRNYVVANPKGYGIVFPGADQKGLYFADWKLDDIQILHITLHEAPFDPRVIATIVAEELYNEGYLKDPDTKIVVGGYSFGSFMALELCKELLDVYDFCPSGLVPMCFTSPQACINPFPEFLPKMVRRSLRKRIYTREVKREYGEPDPENSLRYSAYLQRPRFESLWQWEEEGQRYFKEFVKDMKTYKGPYIGTTPIHYVWATKDRVGNPKRLSDPREHGWNDLTAGNVEISSWLGMHASLVDPISSLVFRDLVLDIFDSMVE